MGAVGGSGQRELSWWTCDRLLGYLEHATHREDFSRGTVDADVVAGWSWRCRPGWSTTSGWTAAVTPRSTVTTASFAVWSAGAGSEWWDAGPLAVRGRGDPRQR